MSVKVDITKFERDTWENDWYVCPNCKFDSLDIFFEYCLGENYQVGAIRRCRQENGVRDDFLPAALGGGTREN